MIKFVIVYVDCFFNDVVNIMREKRVDMIFVVGNDEYLLGYLDIEDINEGLRYYKEFIDMM